MPENSQNRTLRRCRYCKGRVFLPERVRGSEQFFCCSGHKTLYHKYGPVSFEAVLRRVFDQHKIPMERIAITEIATQIECLVDSRIFEAIRVFRMEDATRRMGMREIYESC